MGGWMDSRREIKIGDEVICVKEESIPRFIGAMWRVEAIETSCDRILYFCTNFNLYEPSFIFLADEIVLPSSLIKELL
jgi:hypothetical protein